jgi:2-polyprenyl-6-methoxyphenol hydroxylase-like FAD-dependent oxidoreductase
MTEHAVVIAGGGPTGLMLGAELALAGIDVVIVERRASQDLIGSRAGGLHARTIEVLDQRGIADRFLARGQVAQVAAFASIRLDISDFPTRHPYGLGLRQNHIERILASWVDELKVPISRGVEVLGFAQNDTGVDVELSDGRSLRAQYLVGCDGGRSLVRKGAGIAFPGSDPTTSNLIAVAELADPPPKWGIHRDALGIHALGRVEYEIRNGEIIYADRGPVDILVTEQCIGQTTEPTLSDLSAALVSVYGTDYGIHSPTSISRFTDAARQAASYRKGRVLIAGDAAHVHPPTAASVSRLACRMRYTWDGSWRRWSRGCRRKASSTPATPSSTRSAPACCATRWRRSFFAAKTNGRRHFATQLPNSSAWMSRADDSLR